MFRPGLPTEHLGPQQQAKHSTSAGMLQLHQSRLHASSSSYTAWTHAHAPFTAGSNPLIKPRLFVTRNKACSWTHPRTSATYTVDRVGLPPCASMPLQVPIEKQIFSQQTEVLSLLSLCICWSYCHQHLICTTSTQCTSSFIIVSLGNGQAIVVHLFSCSACHSHQHTCQKLAASCCRKAPQKLHRQRQSPRSQQNYWIGVSSGIQCRLCKTLIRQSHTQSLC